MQALLVSRLLHVVFTRRSKKRIRLCSDYLPSSSLPHDRPIRHLQKATHASWVQKIWRFLCPVIRWWKLIEEMVHGPRVLYGYWGDCWPECSWRYVRILRKCLLFYVRQKRARADFLHESGNLVRQSGRWGCRYRALEEDKCEKMP